MTTSLLICVSAVVCLAYGNGANDNFKGVATLFGSGTTRYGGALIWAMVTTLLGSLAATFFAEQLLKSFTGKGLVPDQLTASSHYVTAVALGAGLTVLLATRLGMPISTTHSLVGALIGAGWASGSVVHWDTLRSTFFAPLLVSPFAAMGLMCGCYPLLRRLRRGLGIVRETCVCLGSQVIEIVPSAEAAFALQRVQTQLTVRVGDELTCRDHYCGSVLGIQVATVLDGLHFLSAGAVSFARGLNDTPKIAALLLLVPSFGGFHATAVVGGLIALGGLFNARRIARTMSQKITPMSPGQGFAANVITGLVVFGASRWGLPVSTTHVSCGALFGVGAVTGEARMKTIGSILITWVTTLPVAALLAAVAYWFQTSVSL